MNLKIAGTTQADWDWLVEQSHTSPTSPSAKSQTFKSDLYAVELFDTDKTLIGYITLAESVVVDFGITEIIRGVTELPDLKSNQ